MTESEALARLVPSSDEAPHAVVLWLEGRVHEVTPHGEYSGTVKDRTERFPVTVTAPNRAIAVRKMNETLERIKKMLAP